MISVQSPNQGGEIDAWHMLNRFILRTTGFAFDQLDSLRFSRSSRLVTAIVQVKERVTQLQQVFTSEMFPRLCDEETAAGRDRETFRMWYAVAKKIRLGSPVDPALIERIRNEHNQPDLSTWLHGWNATINEQARLRAEGESCFVEELADQRTTLHEIVIAPRFQEALWLSNPGVYETGWHYYARHWERTARPSKIKHLERRFYTYLQRFCAKNDTTSFFGPLNYGTWGEQGQSAYHRTSETIRQRHVFLAYWAVEALAKCITSDATTHPYLVPRRHPARRRPSGNQQGSADIIYALSDGVRNVSEIAAYLHRPLADILLEVQTLAAQGWLSLAIALPPATLNPLEVLISTVQAWPKIPPRQHWLTLLETFAQSCSRFASAKLEERQSILTSVEERFVAIVGGEARRGQGKMFQDRSLLYEECLGNIDEFHLAHKHYRTIIASLRPLAHLCASYSEALWLDLHTAAGALFEKLSPSGSPLPLTTFVNAWRTHYPTLPSANADAIRQKLHDLVASQCDEHVCSLRDADLAALYTAIEHHIVFSPDILLAATHESALAKGDFRVILGEIHHGIQPVGWMLLFADDPQAWQDAIMACLPHPTEHMRPANLLLGRRMKTAPPEFPGPSVQASAFSERAHQYDLSSLYVERRNGQLRVGPIDERESLLFYPPSYGVPEALYAPFAAFSYPLVRAVPVQLEGHTPRIEIGDVIYQRERWDLATTAVPGLPKQGASFDLLLAFAAFRQRFGMPERVFVRTPTEPKPVYIDFQNALALELLVHLASQSDTIIFVEMCPDADELWLHDENGRYCSEFRTVLSREPSPAAGSTRAHTATLSRGEHV